MTEGHAKSPIDKFRRATAKRLRVNTTEPEQKLWRALRRVPM
jgi:very-short-patch-repair endonuclease